MKSYHPSSVEMLSEPGAAWKNGGMLRLRVAGRSMLPLLRPGDVILVESVEAGAVLPGEVLVFRRDDHFVTHRLVECKADRWLAKGDHAAGFDPPFAPEDLLGRVAAIEPGRAAAPPSRLHPHRGMVRLLGETHLLLGRLLRGGWLGRAAAWIFRPLAYALGLLARYTLLAASPSAAPAQPA